MHEVLVNRLGGLSLPRKSVVRLTDRPDMTLDVYRGRKTTIQYNTIKHTSISSLYCSQILDFRDLLLTFHRKENSIFSGGFLLASPDDISPFRMTPTLSLKK